MSGGLSCGAGAGAGAGAGLVSWKAVERACARATTRGAIKPIRTKPKHITVPIPIPIPIQQQNNTEDEDSHNPITTRTSTSTSTTSRKVAKGEVVTFILRIAEQLRHKPKPKQTKPAPAPAGGSGSGGFHDPFNKKNLERDLLVQELSASHTLLLNKFNVVDYHLLLITREYQSQDDPVNTSDFWHLFQVFSCFPSNVPPLAFYNCGPHSGKSQPHKHVQIVPMPLVDAQEKDQGEGMPEATATRQQFTLEAVIRDTLSKEGNDVPGKLCVVDGLPFEAFLLPLTEEMKESEDRLKVLEGQFLRAKEAVMKKHNIEDEVFSYNLVITQEWLLIVPRSKESYGPIGINAMGFAGTFLVRTEEELDFVLRQSSPFDILTDVCYMK